MSGRIVVTGGAGFLGSHLCEALLAAGKRVLCLDNHLTSSSANCAGFSSHPRFEFVACDVSEPIHVEGAVEGIYHLASAASPVDYQRYPIQTLKAGALGTYHTLGLARSKGARYLLASTSEVYGDPEVHPQPESYWGRVNPVGPRAVYDEAKRFAEALTVAYHRAHGIRTHIIRIFNTYGPRMRMGDGRVIPAFIQQALAGKPLTVHGEGKQSRSFCYVADLIDGMVRVMDSDHDGPINLGNPEEVTVEALARVILELTGSASRLAPAPRPEEDPERRRPDITLARQVLHWEPKVPLKTGLQKTIEWMRGAPVR